MPWKAIKANAPLILNLGIHLKLPAEVFCLGPSFFAPASERHIVIVIVIRTYADLPVISPARVH